MSLILLFNFKKTSEKIPAFIIGILLDALTLYGLYDVFQAFLRIQA